MLNSTRSINYYCVDAWIEIQSLLKSVIKCLDNNEKEVKDLKRQILKSASSESGSSKQKISTIVRVSMTLYIPHHNNYTKWAFTAPLLLSTPTNHWLFPLSMFATTLTAEK